MSYPLVTVLINNYNYGRFIDRAIESVLAQTYPQIQLIVVDDGSTDHSREVIESYGDRLQPIFKSNGGQASSFNTGFAASQGDIICFLDSDDTYEPHKISQIVPIFQTYSEVGWCFHAYRDVENGTYKTLGRNPKHYPSAKIDFRDNMRQGQKPTFAPATSSLCFRHSLLKKILPMPELPGIKLSDNYLKYCAILLEPGYFLDEELTNLIIHDQNAYSRRGDLKALRAEIDMVTAYWLRKKFPEANKFTDRLFGIGLGSYWNTHKVSDRTLILEYFSQASIGRKIEIILRAFYHYKLRDLVKAITP